MYLDFDDMPDNSRVWIFQATNFLEFEKLERMSARLMNFCESWQAHGKDLQASFKIVYDRFVIVVLDEASYQATGCSIDKLTHLIQQLELELSVSLMDRTQIAFRDPDNGLIDTTHMMNFRAALESDDMNAETTVFNNLITTKGQLENEWEVPVRLSWHKQWLPVA